MSKRRWKIESIMFESRELWQRCSSTHSFKGHPFKIAIGFEIGFSKISRWDVLAECLRCGATFTELDGDVKEKKW